MYICSLITTFALTLNVYAASDGELTFEKNKPEVQKKKIVLKK